jgi:hypothetical protein
LIRSLESVTIFAALTLSTNRNKNKNKMNIHYNSIRPGKIIHLVHKF